MMQKFENEYGPEDLVQQIRHMLVNDLHLLSLLNGSFAMSKQGPKSAAENKQFAHWAKPEAGSEK